MRVLVLMGPNLNLLGTREPALYGRRTLKEMMEGLSREAAGMGITLEVFQSNHEGVLIDRLQEAAQRYDGILFNPGGYAHTSVALRDAVAACGLDVILVHMTHTWGRESFRRADVVGTACRGVILGLGEHGFHAGLWALLQLHRERQG